MIKVAVTSDLERFIEEQVRAGVYGSAEEMVAAGLSLLQHDPDGKLPAEELEGLRGEVGMGLKQAERGEFSEFTAEDVIAEGMKKLEGRKGG